MIGSRVSRFMAGWKRSIGAHPMARRTNGIAEFGRRGNMMVVERGKVMGGGGPDLVLSDGDRRVEKGKTASCTSALYDYRETFIISIEVYGEHKSR